MTDKQIELKAQKRILGEKLDEKTIPAILYGSGIANQPLQIKRSEFEKIFGMAGESSLINLETEGEKSLKIIVKSVQRDPIKNNIIHVDLFHVSMNKKITTEVPLEFIGEAPAVKEQGGFIIKDRDSIEIECLPGDLVNHIDIDVSGLKNIGDSLRISDIKLPAGIEAMGDANETIVSVIEPRKEEVVEQPAEAQPVETPAESGAEKKE